MAGWIARWPIAGPANGAWWSCTTFLMAPCDTLIASLRKLRDEGHQFTQDFPPECTPIVAGKIVQPLDGVFVSLRIHDYRLSRTLHHRAQGASGLSRRADRCAEGSGAAALRRQDQHQRRPDSGEPGRRAAEAAARAWHRRHHLLAARFGDGAITSAPRRPVPIGRGTATI